MATLLMTEKYETDIYGVLNCYDRVVISGHLESLCHAKGMTKYLYTHDIRIFDYPELNKKNFMDTGSKGSSNLRSRTHQSTKRSNLLTVLSQD